eukprot:3818463-Rhodomonas_salina.2
MDQAVKTSRVYLVVGLGALVGDEDGAGGIAVGGLVEGARGVGGTERAGLDHEVCLHVRAQRVLRLLAEQIADLVHLSVEDADVLVEPEDVRANRHTHSSIASRCSVLSRRHRVAHQQAQRLRAVHSRVECRAHIRGSLALQVTRAEAAEPGGPTAASAREDAGVESGVVADGTERELDLLVGRVLDHAVLRDRNRVLVRRALRRLQRRLHRSALLPCLAPGVLAAKDSRRHHVVAAAAVPILARTVARWMVRVREACVDIGAWDVLVVEPIALGARAGGIVGLLALLHVGEVAGEERTEVHIVFAINHDAVLGISKVTVCLHRQRGRRTDPRHRGEVVVLDKRL